MGHESRIELWSPNLTTFCFAGFGTDRLRCEEAMKTAGRENPNRWTIRVQQPSTWRGRSEQILLNPVGCEARKIPADAGVFFLDFYLYRTTQESSPEINLLWDAPTLHISYNPMSVLVRPPMSSRRAVCTSRNPRHRFVSWRHRLHFRHDFIHLNYWRIENT